MRISLSLFYLSEEMQRRTLRCLVESELADTRLEIVVLDRFDVSDANTVVCVLENLLVELMHSAAALDDFKKKLERIVKKHAGGRRVIMSCPPAKASLAA